MNKVTDSVYYVGVNDHGIDLFEGQYPVPDGMAYNSYIIMDEKTAILDTMDKNFTDEWLSNIKEVLGDKKPDYLVVQHMEPDHSASLGIFMEAYPDTTVVATSKAFKMISQFFRKLSIPAEKKIEAANMSKLELGSRTLTFVHAPLVHWPEVMMTYDDKDKILFSADGFGKFGALDKENGEWAGEARRYYIGIVGKYGPQVQAVLKKAAGLDIQIICSLHGPVLKENLGYYINLYDTWSAYRPEEKGVLVAYTSVYGHTKEAVMLLAEELKALGEENVVTADLSRTDMSEDIADAFRYDRVVLATTTYNNDIFPPMHAFITGLTEREFKNRTLAIIENGSWAPMAARKIMPMFEKSKNLTWLPTVTLLSSMSDENKEQIKALAKSLREA